MTSTGGDHVLARKYTSNGRRTIWGRLILFLVILSLVSNSRALYAAALTAPAPTASANVAANTVPILIKFRSAATPQQMDDAVRAGGGTVARNFLQIHTRVINVPAEAADRMIAAYASFPAVERAAGAVQVSKAGTPNDPGFTKQWSLAKISWDLAYGVVPISGSAKIAVPDNGANVILMGFSSANWSGALADALDYAWNKGVVLVAATGNDGSTGPTFPAAMANVIGVAATDENDDLAASSNTGFASVAAPGVGIYTTQPGGTYGTVSGTSASAAETAGLAALLIASGKTAAEASAQIRGATDPVAGQSFGRINVASALGAAVTPPPSPTPFASATPGPTPTYTVAGVGLKLRLNSIGGS